MSSKLKLKVPSNPTIVDRCFDNPFYSTTYSYSEIFLSEKYLLFEQTIQQWFQIIDKYTLQQIPSGGLTLYHGYSGYIYMYLYFYLQNKQELFLQKATHCTNLLTNKLDLSELNNNDISMVDGFGGCIALLTVLYDITGKKETSEKLLNIWNTTLYNKCFILDEDSENISNEWLYGRVGYIYGCLFLNTYFKTTVTNPFNDLIHIIMKDGRKLYKNKLDWEWHGKLYLGGVHGTAGILYMLLNLPEVLGDKQIMKEITDTVDWLISIQYPSGNFPSSVGSSSDRLIQFCHGASGVIPLLIKMYKLTNEDKYLQSAKEGCKAIWKYGLLKKGLGLCHGIVGNLYPFLLVFQATGEYEYLWKAIKFFEFGIENQSQLIDVPDRPLSLFEGISGSIIVGNGLCKIMKWCINNRSTDENQEKVNFPIELLHFPCFDTFPFQQ
ncbi:hypothetical protein ABK040_013580 [Willaertia magna]